MLDHFEHRKVSYVASSELCANPLRSRGDQAIRLMQSNAARRVFPSPCARANTLSRTKGGKS